MIWFVLYVLIGLVCGILMYAYHCYKFTKQTYHRTWFDYYQSNDVDESVMLAIMIWPAAAIVAIIGGFILIISGKIKKYFGIE